MSDTRVVVTDFDVPMSALIRFMLKLCFATLIAGIIPVGIVMLLWSILMALMH